MLRLIFHYVGVILLGVGSAIVIYWVYNKSIAPEAPKTPYPFASPVEVIYATPEPRR